MTESETVTCKACGATIDALAVFPGRICVDCYARTPAANAPLTAKGVASMWGRKNLR